MISQKQLTQLKKEVNEVENAYLKAQIARLTLDESLKKISGDLWDNHQCFCRFKTERGLVIYWHGDDNKIEEFDIEQFMEKVSEEIEMIEKKNSLPFED